MKKSKFAAISFILISSILFIAGGQQRLPVGPFTEPVIVQEYFEIYEIVKPANPLADKGRLYVKDSSGTTKLYFLDSAGTETDLLAGGGGGLLNASDITNGIQVTGSGTGIIDLNDGTYENTFHTSQAEGLSGADYRIGLNEALRRMVICDSGDVGVDFGFAAEACPTLTIVNPGGSLNYAYLELYVDTSTSYIKGNTRDLSLISDRTVTLQYGWNGGDGFIIELTNDHAAGDAVTIQSQSGDEFTDSDGRQAWIYVEPKINQSGTAAFDAVYVNPTLTATGDGSTGDGNNLLNLSAASAVKFRIDSTGGIFPVGMKSGVDQSDAGAAAGELYVDTNDDNTIKIGV